MSKLKTYDCIVVTKDFWHDLVDATSQAEAKRLAEDQFNEGNSFRQCDQEILRVEAKVVRS